MPVVDLNRLAREGSVFVSERVPPDATAWGDGRLPWAEPVSVRLRASVAGTGQIVVRGKIVGLLEQECRRCLEPVRGGLDEEVTLVFVSSDDPHAEDYEAHIFEPSATLDVSDAIRQEALLALNPYVVCKPGCMGLCPGCGTNLNRGTCACDRSRTHPAWDALKTLQER